MPNGVINLMTYESDVITIIITLCHIITDDTTIVQV